MKRLDYKEAAGGLVLIFFGMFAVLYAFIYLPMGTINQMGPGMFPSALGILVALLGLAILVGARKTAREALLPNVRSLVAIMLAIAAFSVLVRPFGLIPAISAATAISALADRESSLGATIILVLVLSLSITLIFRFGFGMNLIAIRWPW